MSTTWEKVAEAYGAEFVGGDLIARVNDKNVTLGRKAGSTVVLTLDGEAYAEQLAAAEQVKVRRVARRVKAADDETVADTEDANAIGDEQANAEAAE